MVFTWLRLKYNWRNKNFKDSHPSGTFSDRVQKTGKDLSHCLFFFWLDSFIYERKGRLNLPQEESSECEMNGNSDPLEEYGQIKNVPGKTFVMPDITAALASIAENISTASHLPKHTLPNNKLNQSK